MYLGMIRFRLAKGNGMSDGVDSFDLIASIVAAGIAPATAAPETRPTPAAEEGEPAKIETRKPLYGRRDSPPRGCWLSPGPTPSSREEQLA